MNEALRQFALGVAGVRMWYARAPLPGAAPSPEFDFAEAPLAGPAGPEPVEVPVPRKPDQARSPEPASRNRSRDGLARLQGLLADTGASRSPGVEAAVERAHAGTVSAGPVDAVAPVAGKASPPAPGPAVAAEDESEPPATAVLPSDNILAGKSVSFRLRFWQGQRWLVVSTSTDEAARGLEERLVGNLLKALGDTVARHETLIWPVFRNPAVPGNDAAGAAAVLAGMAGSLAAPNRLWLGVEPEASGAEDQALWQALLAPLGKPVVSFPLSLAALSSEPDSKRQLWQALRPARGA